MPWNVRNLIRASGWAGTPAQSFLNHVIGAASGVQCDVSSYKITAWNFTGAPDPNPFSNYTQGHTFNMSIGFTQGSRAFNVKRTGAVFAVDKSPAEMLIAVSNNSVAAAGAGSTLSVQITRAPVNWDQASVVPGQFWYRDFAYPSTPPFGYGNAPVTFKVQLSGASAGGTTQVSISVSYIPDRPDLAANDRFNPHFLTEFPFPITNRAEEASDFNVEWHNNSSYTDLAYTGFSFDVDSYPQDVHTYYLRWNKTISSSWNTEGIQQFTDNRLG
jgi:hypothetical protein